MRSLNFISLASVASTFQRFKPRRFPAPPQLVSRPRMHRRNMLKTAEGSANMLRPSELFVPIPLEPITPRLAVGRTLYGPVGMADSKAVAPLLEFPVWPNDWQSAPQPPAPL